MPVCSIITTEISTNITTFAKLNNSFAKCKAHRPPRAAGDEDQLLADRIKLTRLNQEYARYNQAMGFKSRAERLEVVGWGRNQAGKSSSQAVKHYKKWTDVPVLRAPKTLAEYYELRYNKPEEWSRLRRSRDTLAEINEKKWDSKFKAKAVNAFNEFLDHNVEMSSHAIGRFLSRSVRKDGTRLFTAVDIVNQLNEPQTICRKMGGLFGTMRSGQSSETRKA